VTEVIVQSRGRRRRSDEGGMKRDKEEGMERDNEGRLFTKLRNTMRFIA
jgi:hypothetical protein